MTFIDSHAHLQWDDYKDDFNTMLQNAKEAGVEFILNIGTTPETSASGVQLANQHAHIYASVGVHPHDAKDCPGNFVETLRTLAQNPKVVAIGEIGLDFFYKHSPKEKQLSVFEKQVLLAKEMDLPVSIHCRDAFEDCLNILTRHAPLPRKGVFHCFTGSAQEAQKAMDAGFYISISGIVTFRKATALQEVVKQIPLEKMLIETDSPFLTPEPLRGKRNEPAYVVHTAKKVAELKNVSVEHVGEITSRNSRTLFRLKERHL